jgi:phage tail sheath protein FI
VNAIRRFSGQGIRVWGARTLAADGDWKYVPVRRLLIFLERSIEQGTQWAAFEPNGEALWSRVAGSVRQFLSDQWRTGALAGQKAEEAFFVRCDRTTMTQDDIDNGRLICQIGVAPLRLAEFVIFSVRQGAGH